MVAVMYWLGWEMGAVEAISLSILVGSSVDYCLHLVEGYLLAGETLTSSPGHSLVWESTFLSQLAITGSNLEKNLHSMFVVCRIPWPNQQISTILGFNKA